MLADPDWVPNVICILAKGQQDTTSQVAVFAVTPHVSAVLRRCNKINEYAKEYLRVFTWPLAIFQYLASHQKA